MPGVSCPFPGCTYVGSNRRNLSIHQNKAGHTVLLDNQETTCAQNNDIPVVVDAHLAYVQPPVGAQYSDQQPDRGASEQPTDESSIAEQREDHHAFEHECQRGNGRLVVLGPLIHRHLSTVGGGDQSCSDSEDESCSDDESDDDTDRLTLASHVRGNVTESEEKLLPVLVKLTQQDQDIVLQTLAEISSEPKQVRWKNGLEFRDYLDGQDTQVTVFAGMLGCLSRDLLCPLS